MALWQETSCRKTRLLRKITKKNARLKKTGLIREKNSQKIRKKVWLEQKVEKSE